MPVTSTPLTSGKPTARRPSPAMVPRGCAISAALVMLRVIAFALILGSTFGNYVQFVGGWESYWPPVWVALGYAAIYQLVCSLFQWGFKAMRWWLPYGIALIASAVPSFFTYYVLIGPAIAGQFGLVVSIAVVLVLVIGGDALPEWVLVD